VNARTQVLLWVAQRATAAVLALCIVVHLVTMVYAMRNGLTAAEILGRTRGNTAWFAFYLIFVAAAAVHAPLGMRTILAETLAWRGRTLDCAVLVLGCALAVWGARAAWAVFG